MRCTPFALERWFARHEFSTRWTLSRSDCDGLAMAELLAGADAEARALWDGLRLGYTESAGHPLLRREIAATYDGVAPEEVLAFVPAEGIYAAMRCLLEPGDRSGVSKTMGLAGLRVGWLVVRDAELRERLAARKDHLTICGSAPSEILALIGLRARDAILARHRERIARNRARLEAFLAERPGALSGSPPRAGPVCLVRLLAGEGATALAERAAAAGLLLVPSSVFGWGDAHLNDRNGCTSDACGAGPARVCDDTLTCTADDCDEAADDCAVTVDAGDCGVGGPA